MLGSFYMLFDKRRKLEIEYQTALNNAREYVEQDIDAYAVENYEKAISIKPSVELYSEFGKYYFDNKQYDAALDIGSKMMDDYAESPAGYELSMDVYVTQSDYSSCFHLNDVCQKKRIKSDKIDSAIDQIEYTFKLTTNYIDVGLFMGDYCTVLGKSGQWGYITKYGNLSTKFEYTKVAPMLNDLAPVVDNDGNVYIIDKSGIKVKLINGIKKADDVGIIVEDVCAVKSGSSWSYYNVNDGKLFGDYEEATALNEIAAVKKNGSWNIIDSKGSEIVNDPYDDVAVDEKGIAYRNERLFVKQNGSWYMIDAEGKKITDEAFEDARLFADTTYAAVKKNGKWGYIDNSGKWFIEPTYDEARSFSNGFAAVKIGDKWGFINSDKELCIECQFDDAKEFSDNGSVFVKEGEEWQFLMLYSYNH